MQSILACRLFLLALTAGPSIFGAPPATPTAPAPAIDKSKLESYIRYAEGYPDTVNVVVDDPAATPLPGYLRLIAHLSSGQTKLDKVYYLTADGKHILSGTVWDLTQNPFLETLASLPTDGPSFGPPEAKITLVIFSDFECPYCREFAKTIRDNLPQNYPKDVRVVFKDFPIDSLHPWARAASESAHCISRQNPEAFWAFHDWIYQHQQEVNKDNLREKTLALAKEQRLDTEKLAACLDTHATAAEVTGNLQEGRSLQIQQTPTFFLNGRTVPGALSWDNLNTVIRMEINRPASIPPAPISK